MGRICNTYGREEKFVQNFAEKVKVIEHSEDLMIDESIII
jgi:hypothetical protein